MHNTCEDSLLATPLILDLVVLTELCERITVCTNPVSGDILADDVEEWKGSLDSICGKFEKFHSVLSLLSYMLKAPLVPPGTPVVNALAAQRQCIINVFRACLGLPAEDFMHLEHKIPSLMKEIQQNMKIAAALEGTANLAASV